jgi:glutamate dehydrogenase
VNDIVNEVRQQRQDEIARIVASNVAPELKATIQLFVERYYAQVDTEDLRERSPADLYGAALSHWSFARKREPGQPRVRAFNPTIEEHGWQSAHTIVEIVNDDMPFLVDSAAMEANRHGSVLHLVIHPILAVERSADGTLLGLAPEGAGELESFIHLEVDRTTGAAALEGLAADIVRVLGDVRAAVTDWKAMQAKAREIAADIARSPPPLPVDEREEGIAFIEWLANNHFTFLGYRSHDLVRIEGTDALKIVPGTGLGILRKSSGKDAAARSAGLRVAPRATHHHQVDVALDGSPAGLPRLHRGQAVRLCGAGLRRASLLRAVRAHGVQRQSR